MATQIENLEAIINDPTSSDVNKELARKNLERLQAVGSAQIQTAAMTGEGDAELMAVLSALQTAMKGGGGNVNMADLRKAKDKVLYRKKGNIPEGLYI